MQNNMIRSFSEAHGERVQDCGRPMKKLRTVDVVDSGSTTEKLLDIPARIQWRNDHGYCGETATQTIGLTHGAWLSQYAVRKAAGGELLIGTETFDKALQHFSFDSWSWDFDEEENPQFESFIVWMKRNLLNGYPVIFGIYVTDGFNDPDYDHIVTAVGIESHATDSEPYHPDDILIFHTNYTTEPVRRRVGSLCGTRQSCSHDSDAGGCIPRDTCYGIAVKSLNRPLHASSTPVRILLESVEEPYISPSGLGEPVDLPAQVECSCLIPATVYDLYRYDGCEAFKLGKGRTLVKSWEAKCDKETIDDPVPIKSNSTVYYQCTPRMQQVEENSFINE